MKRLLALIIVIALVCVFAVGCEDNGDRTFVETFMVTPSELGLPQTVFDDMGLYVYHNGTYYNYAETDYFDSDKPTLIYTHGMGGGSIGFSLNSIVAEKAELKEDSEKYWADLGFNVCSLDWGPFADDDPYVIQDKIWGVNGEKGMRYKVSGASEFSDGYDSYCMAQIYAVYILDLLRKYDYSGEIRMMGHSMGAMLTLATADCLYNLAASGQIKKDYVPERITLFDTFICNLPKTTYVEWLEREMGKYGSASVMAEASAELDDAGVAVEYMRTGFGDSARALNGKDKTYLDFWNSCFMLDYNDTYIDAMHSNIVDNYSERHCVGYGIYSAMWSFDYMTDAGSGNFGFSPRTPTSAVVALNGTYISMDENLTVDVTDDVQHSAAKSTATVGGFVFSDVNGNGIADDGFGSRTEKINVSLYLNGELIKQTVTNYGGYYGFEVEPVDNGEYSLSFDTAEKTITVSPDKASGDRYYLMDSTASAESTFGLSAGGLKIINIGTRP